MKSVLFIFFLSLTAISISQVDEIEKLTLAYDSTLAAAKAEGEEFLIPHFHTQCRLNKRAVGPVNFDATVYFDEFELLHGEDDFPPEKKCTIRKVMFDISSGSYTFRYRYYFSKTGELIKYRETEVGYECYIKTLYFSSRNAIKYHIKPTNEGCLPEDLPKEMETTQLNDQQLKFAHTVLNEADRFKKLLAIQYTLMDQE